MERIGSSMGYDAIHSTFQSIHILHVAMRTLVASSGLENFWRYGDVAWERWGFKEGRDLGEL